MWGKLKKGLAAVLVMVALFSIVGSFFDCAPQMWSVAQADDDADIIEWRYKSENGRLWARLYNYSQECWIGEWQLLP